MLDPHEKALITVGALGALIGIGKIMKEGGPITATAAIGHSVVTGGLALSAFTLLAWIPDAPLPLLVGGAALIASLGTSGLMMFAQRLLSSKISITNANDNPNKE